MNNIIFLFFVMFLFVNKSFSLWFDYKDSTHECIDGVDSIVKSQRNIIVYFTKKKPCEIKNKTNIKIAKEFIIELFDDTKDLNFLEFFEVKNLKHINLIKDIIKDLSYKENIMVYFNDQASDSLKEQWFSFYENLKKQRKVVNVDEKNDIIYFNEPIKIDF